MPDAQVSCLFVSAHHETLLPVSQSLSPKRPVATRLLLLNKGSASSLSVCPSHCSPLQSPSPSLENCSFYGSDF